MGERVGIQDVNSFVTTLIQSATFGTSIAEALRVYAEESARQARDGAARGKGQQAARPS